MATFWLVIKKDETDTINPSPSKVLVISDFVSAEKDLKNDQIFEK